MKGTITIKHLDSKENPFAVDFEGHNEGTGSPCKDEDEVQKEVKSLISRYGDKYTLEITDKRKRFAEKRRFMKQYIKLKLRNL